MWGGGGVEGELAIAVQNSPRTLDRECLNRIVRNTEIVFTLGAYAFAVLDQDTVRSKVLLVSPFPSAIFEGKFDGLVGMKQMSCDAKGKRGID